MKRYHERMQEINDRAQQMREAIVIPILDTDNGGIIAESAVRNERLEAVTDKTIFESAGPGAATIQAIGANAVGQFARLYGELPPPDLLASAHKSIENMMLAKDALPPQAALIAEAATTTDILVRDRFLAMVLPVLLNAITSRMVTFIPGTFNQSEIFRIRKIADSTFGDLTQGDIIDYTFNGQYSSMDQRFATGTGDGLKTGAANDFALDMNAVVGASQPIKRKSVKIFHDRNLVASDNGEGALFGTFSVGATTITVTGTVTYGPNGVVNPVFSVAPANGIEIHVGVDVDIEADPTLIPAISHAMDSRVLYPHESAINMDATIQALWLFKREYNMDLEAMSMTHLRNFLSGERDRKILNDIRFFLQGSTPWEYTVPAGTDWHVHYESLKQVLLQMDAAMMARTRNSGLVGLVFDSTSASLVKSMRAPAFVPVAGYKRSPQPHYIGRLFGLWDAYEDPQAPEVNHALAFGLGNTVGEAGYVAGDCIPAIPFAHPTLRDLRKSTTMWSLGYRDVHPFDGRGYFMDLAFVP